VFKPSKTAINRWHCSGNEKNKFKLQCTVSIQNTEADLQILLRILSTCTNIPSLIHLHDQDLYAWTQDNTITICTSEKCQNLPPFYFSIGRATFNPHLNCGILFHTLNRYWLPTPFVLSYLVVTIQTILRRVVSLQ